MKAITIEISKYTSNDPQPGIVECKLIDVNGQEWIFLEKTAVVASQYLDDCSCYPQSGIIACEIIEIRQGKNDCEIVKIDTAIPWGVTATTGESVFEVLLTQIIDV